MPPAYRFNSIPTILSRLYIMKFAIISPATEVMPLYIDGAVAELCRCGHEAVVLPHAKGPRHGTFAASDADRLSDLEQALTDPSVDVILCARGGYGCVHLLSERLERLVSRNRKWLVGFSDISALHALWLNAGAPSLHASMAKQLALRSPESQADEVRAFLEPELGPDADREGLLRSAEATLRILEGAKEISYTFTPAGILNAPAPHTVAEGIIMGGNLAVLNGLAATRWDILSAERLRGRVLFLEDVGEKIYQVERMLTRLHLAGVFDAVSAVVFGTFTDYRADRNYPSMEAMIADRFKRWGVRCPVVTGAPIGHQSHNLPIPEGWHARLDISAPSATLTLTAVS